MDSKPKSDINEILNKLTVSSGQQTFPVVKFIEKLIEEKGFPDITSEIKEDLKKDLIQRLDDFLAAKIIAALSDENISQFETMLKEGKSMEELQKFSSSHIPDYTSFLTNALLEFRAVYLGLITPPEVAMQPVDDIVAVPPPPPPAPKPN